MSSARLRRPPVADVREWYDLTVAALNEAGVRIGEEFVIVRADEYERPGRSPLAPSPGSVRHSDPATSRSAAKDVTPRSGTQRGRLLAAIAEAGSRGATSEEAAETAGVSFSRSSGPRIAELLAGGYIRDTGATRRGSLGSDQRVLAATERGREILGLVDDPPLFSVPEDDE